MEKDINNGEWDIAYYEDPYLPERLYEWLETMCLSGFSLMT